MMKLFLNNILFVVSILVFYVPNGSSLNHKIAIVNGNFTGALCAYYLHQLNPNIDIDIYDQDPEKEKHKVVKYHSKYKQYMDEIIEEFKLTTKNIDRIEVPIIYDPKGNHERLNTQDFQNAYPDEYEQLIEFLTVKYENFQKIYKIQNDRKKTACVNIRCILDQLDKNFFKYFGKSAFRLIKENIKPISGNEERFFQFLNAFVVKTYFKNLRNIHGFVGLAGLWFSDLTGKVRRFEKSSYEISRQILKGNLGNGEISKGRRVKSIMRRGNEIVIISKKGKSTEQSRYHFVIIADSNNDIKYQEFVPKIPNNNKYYKEALITFVDGKLRENFIPQDDELIEHLIDTHRQQGIMKRGDGDRWAVISCKKLTKEDLKDYFQSFVIGEPMDLQKLPDYSQFHHAKAVSFILAENLYYANVLEWAGVYTELTAIGAKNVALLIDEKIKASPPLQE